MNSPDATAHGTRKRRRSPLTNDNTIGALKGATRPRRTTGNKPLSARLEIRTLKMQVAVMEAELQGLQLKWANQLPDARTLAASQRSTCKKHENDLIITAHNQLQEMFLQQQFTFAALQSAICHAPLRSSGMEILKALHFDTRLGHDPEERNKMLKVHNERSLATLSSVMHQLTHEAVYTRLGDQGKTESSKSVLPISQIDVTGGKDCTLVSSVFVSEVPHNSLEDVYAGVLAYFDSIPASMKRHFDITATRTRLNSVDAPAAYWQMKFDGVGLPATVNHVVCSELTSSLGIVHCDAVTDDPMHPSSSLKYDLCGITLTPCNDLTTGRTVSVTLRWVVLYRYNMLPDDPALRKNLEIIRPILNGDLITASVCSYIQRQRSPTHLKR